MLNIILRGGRLTKYRGVAASFAPDSGISSPGVATNSAPATVLERMASALGSSVSAHTLGSVGLAAGLMLLPGAAHAAPNACTVDGNVVTCTGNQSAGIASGTDFIVPPIDTLNVNTLTQAIAPATTVNGINFQRNDGLGITVNVDTGAFGITTTGNGAKGISARDFGAGNVSVTSTGNIATDGSSADGIYAYVEDDGDLTVNSTGNISTMGSGAEGIRAKIDDSGDLTIISNGNISTTGVGANGIEARLEENGDLTITSTGNITAANALGIEADLDGVGAITINVAGAVSGTTGILIRGRDNNAPTTINNSAVITGTDGVAINFQGEGNDTLNILPGSVINGTIDFGNGNANDVDTLNVGPGVNAVFTFADAGGLGQGDTDLLSAPENITGNVALINGGTQAVAVDSTGFAAAGAAVGGLTTGIFSSIENSIGAAQGSAPLTGGITPAGGNTKAYGSNRRLWVSGFGGKQKVDGSSNQAGIKGNFGGVITGVETSLDARNSYGVFGGFARNRIDLEFNAGDVETDSVFGGAYWKMDYGAFQVQLAFVAGSADQDTTRNVGGTTARGEADGWFFSPSLTLAAPIEGLSFPLIVSGRVSYAGLFLDGYTETGVVNPLTVGDRDVSVFSTRAQLTLPQVIANKDGSTTQIDWRAGVDAQFDAGSDNVSLTVGGTPLSFSADLDNAVAGFIGSTVTYTTENGLYSLSASGELQSTFDGGYKAVGQLRGIFNF